MLTSFAERECGGLASALILQDGAPQHTHALAFAPDATFHTHPSQSPDLNPIEHCWLALADLIEGIVLPCSYTKRVDECMRAGPVASDAAGAAAPALAVTEGVYDSAASDEHTARMAAGLRAAVEVAWQEVDSELICSAIAALPVVMRAVHEKPEVAAAGGLVAQA